MIPKVDNTYCHNPFKQITLKHWEYNGQLSVSNPCCQMTNNYNNKLHIDGIQSKTPQEIFDSKQFEDLRNDLLEGKRNASCDICWKMENDGIKSFRLFSVEPYDQQLNGFTHIDLSLSNKCNLRCRMCSPSSSHSLIIDSNYFLKHKLLYDFEKSSGMDFIHHKRNEVYNSIQIKWLLENTEKIKVLKCSGGEPFYDQKVLDILRVYVEKDHAKDTYLQFHTNATQFNKDDVTYLNSQFKELHHTFSIDGVDKVYEYIRYGSFQALEDSIETFLAQCKNKKHIGINLTLSVYNLLNVKEWQDWARLLFNSYGVDFHLNVSEVYPFNRGINIKHLPIYILEEAKKRCNNFQLHSIIDKAIEQNNVNKRKMMTEIQALDQSRDQDFNNFLDPMLCEWLQNDIY